MEPLYYSTARSVPAESTLCFSFADCLKSILGPCLASEKGRVGAWAGKLSISPNSLTAFIIE